MMVMKTHTAVSQAMTPVCLRNVSKDGDCLLELVVATYHFAWFLYLKDHNMKVNIVLACAGSQCILCTAWNDFHPNTRFTRGQLLFGTLNCGCDSVYGWEIWWRPYADLPWLPDGLLSVQNIFYINPEQTGHGSTWIHTWQTISEGGGILHNFVCIVVQWLIYMPAYHCPYKRCWTSVCTHIY